MFSAVFLFQKKLFWEVSQIKLKIYGNYFQYETKTEPEGQSEGRHRGTRRHLAAAPPLVAPGDHLVALAIASRRPFAYKFPSDLKTEEGRSYFPEYV